MPNAYEGPSSWEKRAEMLSTAAYKLMQLTTVQPALDAIVQLAAEVVPGCEQAGITLIHSGGQVSTPASFGEAAETIDGLQQALAEGPCMDAARTGGGGQTGWLEGVVEIPDVAAEDRWPRLTGAMRDLGIQSTLSYQLFNNNSTVGALNLYAHIPNGFTEHARQVGLMFASHASVALASALKHEQLQQAITTRGVIGQAMGMLMERDKLTAEQAYQELRRASNNTNIKLRDLAERVAQTGQMP